MAHGKQAMDAVKGLKIAQITGLDSGSPQVALVFDDGQVLTFYHEQDCCESVGLYDCEDSDESDYEGATIHEVYEAQDVQTPEKPEASYWDESQTWTFYRIVTNRGTLVLRFLGQSNGYYSEGVSVRLSDRFCEDVDGDQEDY